MNTKHILLLMAAALMMAACAFDDPMEKQKPWVETDPDAPMPVRFSVSTVNNIDFTRAETSIVTFDAGEYINVRVKPMGEENYTPYVYTTAGTGQTNVALTAPAVQPYFPAGIHSTVDAYAYYPSTALSEPKFTVLDNQSTPEAYKASDLMIAPNRTITKITDTTDPNYGDGTTHLTMQHLMTQLRIKAMPGEESGITISRIEVEAKNSVTFTPEGSTFAETLEDVGTVIVRQGEGEGYVLIPPQAIGDVLIKVVTGGGTDSEIATYGFTAAGNFEAGCSYGVDITVIAGQLGMTTAISNWNGLGSVVIAPSGDLVIEPIGAKAFIDKDHPITLTTTGENPELVVKKNGDPLTEGVHYKVEYLGNNKAGTAYVIVSGLKGTGFDYEGSIGVAPFTITQNASATISYAGCPSMEVTYGDEPFVNEHLFNDGDGTITYESSDPTVATVNPYTGQVTIVKPSDDPITITATAANGPNYIYAVNTASYSLKVNKAAGSISFLTANPAASYSATDSENKYSQTVEHTGDAEVVYSVPDKGTEGNTCGATISGSTVSYTQGGSVIVTATVEDTDYYTYAVKTATYTLDVGKANGFVTLSPTYGGVVYQGETSFTVTTHHEGGEITVTSEDESIATATIEEGTVTVTGTGVGTTKITVTCAATAQYTEGSADYIITVATKDIDDSDVQAPTKVNGLVYDGQPKTLVNAGSAEGGTMEYRLNENANWSSELPKATDAGTYIVYWHVAGDDNHNGYSGSSVSVTIAKANPTYTAPTAVNGLIYDGSSKTLINAGTATGGTMQYRVGDSGNFETSLPTAVEAGTYQVYWQVVGDGNHKDYSGSPVSVTIGSMTAGSVTITLDPSSYTYTGSECKPTPTVKSGTTTIPSSEYTVSYSNNVNAGTATVTITDKEGGNYEVNGSTTFTINPKTVAAPTITLSQTNYTYNGLAKKPEVSVMDGFSTTIPENEYTVSYSNNTDAGTATVTITDKEGGNYTVSGSTTFTISKATSSIGSEPVKTADFTYDGNSHELLGANAHGSATGGTLKYKVNDGEWSTTVPKATNAGEYTIYRMVDGGNNYTDVSAASIGKVTINQKSLTITANPQTVTYGTAITQNKTDVTPSTNGLVSGHGVSSVTLTQSTNNVTTTGKITPTGVVIKDGNGSGSNTVTSNYKISFATGNLTITQKPVTITANAQTVTYGTGITTGAGQVTPSGLLTGHSVSAVSLTQSTTDATTSGTITPSGATIMNGSSNVTSNYSITYKTGKLTINRKELTSNDFYFATNAVTVSYVWDINGYQNPTLNKPGNCSVTYTSSVAGVATVNSSTGVLTYGGTAGTATTITATATGNYKGTATYTIKANYNYRDFGCTSSVVGVTLPPGTYQLQVWGAQGGMPYNNGNYPAARKNYAKGGYSIGNKTITSSQTFYVCVGGQGGNGVYYDDSRAVTGGVGGYNGGGDGGGSSTYPSACAGAGGGGATHIALGQSGTLYELLNDNSKKSSVLIVAGGGGGNTYHQIGGHGGGATGGASADAYPYGVGGNTGSYTIPIQEGTSSNTGKYYLLGQGQNGYTKTQYNGHGTQGTGGGGGGYYGGRAYQGQGPSTDVAGAGGTGYTGGVTNGSTSAGQREGDGYARITWISK